MCVIPLVHFYGDNQNICEENKLSLVSFSVKINIMFKTNNSKIQPGSQIQKKKKHKIYFIAKFESYLRLWSSGMGYFYDWVISASAKTTTTLILFYFLYTVLIAVDFFRSLLVQCLDQIWLGITCFSMVEK